MIRYEDDFFFNLYDQETPSLCFYLLDIHLKGHIFCVRDYIDKAYDDLTMFELN